jgi:hypothetical protein
MPNINSRRLPSLTTSLKSCTAIPIPPDFPSSNTLLPVNSNSPVTKIVKGFCAVAGFGGGLPNNATEDPIMNSR